MIVQSVISELINVEFVELEPSIDVFVRVVVFNVELFTFQKVESVEFVIVVVPVVDAIGAIIESASVGEYNV